MIKTIYCEELKVGMYCEDTDGKYMEVTKIVKVNPKTIDIEFNNDRVMRLDKWGQVTVDTREPTAEELEAMKKPKKKDKKDELKFYSLKNILSKNADYNIIFGERSNGKTYASLEYAIREFYKSGYKNQMAYLRRWKEDIRGKRADTLFSGLTNSGIVHEITKGEYSTVYYQNGKYYLSNYDTQLQKHIYLETPLAFAFALSEMEHDKSTSYPNITTVVFDEFLTRKYYLPDEFILFTNVLSTIIRYRDNVKIFMLGNTVNKFCPYFTEMGLRHIGQMEQGTIDIYTFGDNQLKIAVEYAANLNVKKPSNKYFCFDDKESVRMIINGAWEMAIYPHLSIKYKPEDILLYYFIELNNQVLQCEIIQKNDVLFTYIHEKTTPIKDRDTAIIYTQEHNEKRNYKRRIFSKASKLEQKIAWFYANEKVFFQNNEVGEIVRNYILQTEVSQWTK